RSSEWSRVAGSSERTVALGRVHCFQLLPGPNGGRHRRSGIRGHELAEKVDVPRHRRSSMRRLGSIETDVLLHEVAIRDARPTRQLSVAPTIQSIARTGAALVRRIELARFSLEECFGLGIVRVEDDMQIES